MQFVRLTLFSLLLYSAHTLRLKSRMEEDQEPNNVATPSTYSINGSSANAATPKIVILITTHGSNAHMSLLRSCWPGLMKKRLPTLSQADVILHSNGNVSETELRQAMVDWPNKIARIAIAKNLGYQKGAIQSMAEALEKGWFEGYDWVIRINPDVIFMKETGILSRMSSNYAGIFANCNRKVVQDGHGIDVPEGGPLLHTDFYAAKTDFLIKEKWMSYSSWKETREPTFNFAAIESNRSSAELSGFAEKFASWVGFRNILEQRLDSWMIHNGTGGCRVSSEDIIHNHKVKNMVQKCQQFAEDPSFDHIAFNGHGRPEPEIHFLR